MKKLVFALALLLPAVSALHAQSVQQSGNVSPNHVSIWATNGVIKDGGTASNPFATSFGVVGGSICVNSGPITGAYNALCFTATLANGGVVSIYNYGGATGGLSFVVNGIAQGLPLVPLPTTTNDPVCFANSSGSLKDCGFTFTGFANPTASIGLVAVNGAATTALRSDSAPPLSASVQSALTQPLNQILLGTGAFGFSSSTTLPATAFANPTASIGLAAINGAAVTAMRSDAAPALNQAISPTCTGIHTFNGNVNYTGTSQQVFVATTGNDSNDCLTSGTACLTIAHAIIVGLKFDAKNNNLTVNIGSGTFNVGALLIVGAPRGATVINGASEAGIWLVGNGSANTIIDNTGASCNTITTSGSGTQLVLQSLTLQQTGSCTGGSGLFAQDLSYVNVATDVKFGNVGTNGGSAMHAEGNSVIEITAAYGIGGSGSNFFNVSHGGNILIDGDTGTCSGTNTFTNFASAQEGGKIIFFTGSAFSTCGSLTGSRFSVISNALIDTFTQNASFLPGNTAGSRASGGLYLPLGVPTVGACTNGTVAAGGTDGGFQVNFTGANSTCTVVFAVPKAINAICSFSSNGPVVNSGSLSASQVTFTGTFANANFVNVNCSASWLLDRDLNPANDNRPVGLPAVA